MCRNSPQGSSGTHQLSLISMAELPAGLQVNFGAARIEFATYNTNPRRKAKGLQDERPTAVAEIDETGLRCADAILASPPLVAVSDHDLVRVGDDPGMLNARVAACCSMDGPRAARC